MAKIKVKHVSGQIQVIEDLTDPTVVNDGTAYTVFDVAADRTAGPPSKFVATFPLKQVESIQRED